MLRFLTLNDLHISAKNPRSRKDSYKDSLFSKLKYVSDLTKELDITATLIAGDIFHEPQPHKITHSLVKEVMEIFSSFKGDILAIPGNHDMLHDSFKNIEKQPICVLHQAKALHLLDYGNKKYKDGEYLVEVQGSHYNIQDPLVSFRELKETIKTHNIILAHMDCTPDGNLSYTDKCFSYSDLSEFPFDVLVLGHLHHDYGIKKIKNKLIYNLGSFSRGSLSEDNLNREIEIGYLEFKAGNFKPGKITIPSKPGYEIFSLKEQEEIKQEEIYLNEFISNLHKNLDIIKENPIEKIESLELNSELKNLCLSYLSLVS